MTDQLFLRVSGNVQFSIIELAMLVTSQKKADDNFKVFVGMLPRTDLVLSSRLISSRTSVIPNLQKLN